MTERFETRALPARPDVIAPTARTSACWRG